MSKIFEKLLQNRLQPILTQTNAIPHHQFGFRRQHSTIEQIHRVTNKISTSLDEKQFCVAVYLDVAKAFDSVWHKGLVHKLANTVPKDYLQLLKSYLTDRCFYVRYKDKCSLIHPIKAGVPQGSILGPLLYILFTADIPNPDSETTMIATFADDTVLLNSGSSLQTTTDQLQDTLDKTLDWFSKWHIKVNEDKTVQVIYTTKTKYTPLPLTINNKQVSIQSVARYLGMHLDSKLTWKHLIQQKQKQIKNKFRQLYWLLRPQSKLSIYNKLLIYKSIIKPIWTYGIQIWGTSKKTNIEIIQRQQTKILRTITNAEWYICTQDIHQDLQINTIDEEIKKISTKYLGKILSHSNYDICTLFDQETYRERRLKRKRPSDLVFI